MARKWTIEAFVSGRRIEVTSDGTESGTTYTCDNDRDGKLVSGNIYYEEEFELAYDGMKVKSSYTPLGMMAAISGVEINRAIFTKVPVTTRQEIADFYAHQTVLKRKYEDVTF